MVVRFAFAIAVDLAVLLIIMYKFACDGLAVAVPVADTLIVCGKGLFWFANLHELDERNIAIAIQISINEIIGI